ncbi:MAG: SlyX family protein [Gallionellaceae bacterium]|nr:SlyX family protein [Gallionellaceae bacterium]MDD5364713.1 SlyX family protein [Gallionellaceae bacterium]
MTDLAERVTELEIKLGFAEDMIDTLNQSVFRQQEQIDLLQRQLTEMHRRMRESEAVESRDPGEELPPHY